MDIFYLLDSLQSIARDGLYYAQDAYDRERYEHLFQLATQTYSELLHIPEEALREQFLKEIGYITPKVGTDAAIFNARGEILLSDRADGAGWCLPCGFVEPDETPAEGIIREVQEETGLEVKILCMVGVFTRKASAQNGPHTTVSILHLCEVTGGQLRASHESRDVRYWLMDDVPRWHAAHETKARSAFRVWKSTDILPAISS
jgi:ADP-ribose pyrophosphatase YjhB (NUDIX family)